ncbi:MAG: thioredoxin family protein [Planctomycetota bacterium]|nr:MAG: thioredoxin family protein [Planctomycetota bacterium]REJ86665.1 MAG: thioredoxin family protein [Planctomycetota bacterium]
MRGRLFLGLLFTSLTVGNTAVLWAAHGDTTKVAADEPSIVWQASPEDAWRLMRDENRPLLLFITTDGCGYCTQMKKKTYRDAKLASEVARSFVALRIHAERDVDEAWLERFEVQVYPTTLIFTPDRVLADRFNGFVAAEQLHSRLTELVVERAKIREVAQREEPAPK